MSDPGSKAAASLTRHRTVIFAITAIAAGFIFYAVGDSLHFLPRSSETKSTSSLHRSNAQRRRRSRRGTNLNGHEELHRISPDCLASVSHEQTDPQGLKVYGRCIITTPNGSRAVWLNPPDLPSALEIHERWDVDVNQASKIRDYLAQKLLDSFFAEEMPPGVPVVLPLEVRERFVAEFMSRARISASTTEAAMDRYQTGVLQDHARRRAQADGMGPAEPSGAIRELSLADLDLVFINLTMRPRSGFGDNEIIADVDSNHSHEAEGGNQKRSPEEQNLMNLLYKIAENQSKKEGVVHRGVTCDSCHAIPIRGTRYRCMNCRDYDLCEQCEALQVHDKTHLFYKIRIPAPFLSNPSEPTPVWYPGRHGESLRSMTPKFKSRLSTSTGLSDSQVDAYWDQFQSLASSHHPNDPLGCGIAIDKDGFDQCFAPNTSPRPPPPNLIRDRMFSFYDTNDDGLIDFGEYLCGIACITDNGKELRTRIFRAYDIDNDGYVDRKDFLRMFRAQYALTRELTKQIVSGMDDEFPNEENARELIAGGQPISSIFSKAIPVGRRSRICTGKTKNRHGDQLIYDGQGIMRQEDSRQVYGDAQYGDNLVLDNAELAHFGHPRHPWLPEIPRWTLDTDDDTWSERRVRSQDVEEALGRVAEPETVKDRTERSLVLCANQESAQQDYWIREGFRRRTAVSRWQAREFYLDEESAEQPPWTSAEAESVRDKDFYVKNDLCSLRIRALDQNEVPELIEGFHNGIKRRIQQQWPDYPDLAKVPDRFSAMIRKNYKWHNLAEALAPTRADIPEATSVVKELFDEFFNLRELVTPRRSLDASECGKAEEGETKQEVGNSDDKESRPMRISGSTESPQPSELWDLAGLSPQPAAKNKWDRNDKHRECSTESVTSKGPNTPVDVRDHNEHDAAALWPDIRREVIYQITQESMNELLDPMFELREALALEVTKTKRERELRKDQISECFRNDFAAKVMKIFQVYQKRWYQTSREGFDRSTSSQLIKFVKFILRCFGEPEFRDVRPSIDRMNKSKDADSAILQQAIQAFIKPDKLVAEATHDESSTSASQQQPAIAENVPGRDYLSKLGHPAFVEALHDGIFALDQIDVSVQETTKQKSLESLLADAGYGTVTPHVEDFESVDTSLVSSPGGSSRQDAKEDEPDPTLPQNRPDSPAVWHAKRDFSRTPSDTEDARQPPLKQGTPEQPEADALPPLSDERLLILAVWNVIEDDDISRGAPGRLNLHDYELIMEGEKGEGLGFVGGWIETAVF
ncbi:MAG: hypothetical protein L6R41_004751 [Letrouitia leprolyta]|nr:MAG: hypothetical protein L6R41_004751 [Letrouitia leprolyta]